VEPNDTGVSARAVVGAVADRLGVSPTAVVAGFLAVLAAGLGGWWALRAPDPPAAESVIPSVFESPIPISSVPATSTSIASVLVDVGGAVVFPGVHELRPGDRVVDAIRAAGGLTTDADRERLNMAMPVSDGQRIWIPRIGEVEPSVVVPEGGARNPAGGDSPSPATPVDINLADAARLETLPGIGPSLAAAIIAYRTGKGPFARVEDLTKVPGIGRVKMQQLAELVSV